ncbi:hypothetical protein JB92DRAFT_3144212 [Gautieria morchelliformis]|nr:hypothetical protein JB92DRAFT_3144212 [Gautieria morchelliformis]
MMNGGLSPPHFSMFIVFTNISFPTSIIPLTMSASAPDNSRCATDVPGEGCGEIFSRKTAAGLCARCHHLTKITDDALEHGRFAQILQCGDCELTFKNITGVCCGACKKLKDQELGHVDQILIDKHHDRVMAFNAQLSRNGSQPLPASNPLSQVNNQLTISLTTESITAAKQAAGPACEAHLTVCIDVRTRGKISSAFGSTVRAYPESVTMAEIHADVTASVNQTWAILDDFIAYWNSHRVRTQHNKLMPSGATPCNIFTSPGAYGGERCSIPVSQEAIDALRKNIPFNHEEALNFCDEDFSAIASGVWSDLNSPPRTVSNGWEVFTKMLPLLPTSGL